jgi:hypothetical protein
VKYVLVRGGDKNAPTIAKESGWLYGVRNDYTVYSEDIYMLDIHWTNYVWADYLELVKKLRPTVAMVADYEQPSQRRKLYRQIRDLKPLVQKVMVCPKFNGAIAHIPSFCMIAVSIPTSYAGFLPPMEELRGRKLHLLGGNPQKQADFIRKANGAGAKVISLDANYHVRKAGLGQFWQYGKWVQTRGKQWTNTELAIESGKSLRRFFDSVLPESQPSLFEAVL